MFGRKFMALVGMLTLGSLLLVACTPAPTQAPVTEAPATEVPAAEVPPTPVPETPTPEPPPPEPKVLVICQSREPESLYLYGSAAQEAQHIWQALYDGPIDNRTYAYQSVILEKLPSLEDGDATIVTVIVQAGDWVVNAEDVVVELSEGVRVRPAGCRAPDCEIEFDGEPVQMDQMSAWFVIREDVSWSDGSAVTADDSVYSYEIVGDPDAVASRYIYQRTASYEAVDGQTVVWTGLPGYIDNLYYTNFWSPLPRRLWQEQLGYTAGELLTAPESSRMPLGWGPFVVTEWVAGEHIILERNPYYFRASEGLPYLDAVIFRFIPDVNAAVVQLLAGECDIITHDVPLSAQAEILLQMEERGLLELLFVTDTVWEHVDFGINPVGDYDRPDFFGDVRLRRAIAHCLDRQGVVDTLLYGRSVVPDSYVPPEHPLYADERLATYEYDPATGMALLEGLGWVDDGEGPRVAQDIEGIPDGTPLAFNWTSNAVPERMQYMQFFQQNLEACGIEVNLQSLPTAEWFAEGPTGPLFGRRFDMGSFAWRGDVEPPCELYASWQTPSAENGWEDRGNNTGFSNEAYDAACRLALESLPGTEDYIEGHLEAQRIFSEQLPVIPLYLHLRMVAARLGVIGLSLDSTETSEMWNIEAFDLP